MPDRIFELKTVPSSNAVFLFLIFALFRTAESPRARFNHEFPPTLLYIRFLLHFLVAIFTPPTRNYAFFFALLSSCGFVKDHEQRKTARESQPVKDNERQGDRYACVIFRGTRVYPWKDVKSRRQGLTLSMESDKVRILTSYSYTRNLFIRYGRHCVSPNRPTPSFKTTDSPRLRNRWFLR